MKSRRRMLSLRILVTRKSRRKGTRDARVYSRVSSRVVSNKRSPSQPPRPLSRKQRSALLLHHPPTYISTQPLSSSSDSSHKGFLLFWPLFLDRAGAGFVDPDPALDFLPVLTRFFFGVAVVVVFGRRLFPPASSAGRRPGEEVAEAALLLR